MAEENKCRGEWKNDCPHPLCECAKKQLEEMKKNPFDAEQEPRPTFKNRYKGIEPSKEMKEAIDATVELIDTTISEYQRRLMESFQKAFTEVNEKIKKIPGARTMHENTLFFSLNDIKQIVKDTK